MSMSLHEVMLKAKTKCLSKKKKAPPFSKNKVFVKKKKKLRHSVKTKLVNNIKKLFFYSFKVFLRNLIKFSHIFFHLNAEFHKTKQKEK